MNSEYILEMLELIYLPFLVILISATIQVMI